MVSTAETFGLISLATEFLEELQKGFAAFRASVEDPLNDEYLLPEIVGRLVRRKGQGLAYAGRVVWRDVPGG